jgi:hypothetical protein
MIKLGYDGTMYENIAERGGVSYSFTSPNQIKHIDNNGNFSTENDDISATIQDMYFDQSQYDADKKEYEKLKTVKPTYRHKD